MRPIVAREAADEQVVLDAALLYVDVLLKRESAKNTLWCFWPHFLCIYL